MKKLFIIVFTICFSWLTIFAQKTYTTNRITGAVPKIDGNFEDKAWTTIEWEGDFTQHEPNNGDTPSQKTFFKILYDDNNIYVAIKLMDTEADKITKRLSRRDAWDGDKAGIHIDSYNDKQTAFTFVVNAAGVKNDGIFTLDGSNFDDSWDPIWNAKTMVHSEGWNAEIQIPLSQLRFGKSEEQLWGLQIVRLIYRTEELVFWNHISKEKAGWVRQYGEIDGIKNIKPKRQIEIAPYIMGSYQRYEKEEGNPFADGSDFTYNAGLDGKIGITNDLILDFAINPDFGQVEADPSEVNLTAFETFLTEKRPFFIEGKNITNFQITPGGNPWSRDNLFYSRRIGDSPQLNRNLEEDEYAKTPNNTRILGAFKLTGKTKNGWSIGIIESVTNQEKAIIDLNGNRTKEIIEPYTNYLISRLQKDINKGNTVIGGMLTSTYRDINTENLSYFNKSATTYGFDFTQFFAKKKYYLKFKGVGSHVTGSKDAIYNQQTSSRRYYQRTDIDYITLDSNRTSLSGHGANIAFGKSANTGLRYSFDATWRSPGIELNDNGYMRRANSVFQYIWANYRIDKPFFIFRKINISANEWAGWDFGGTNTFFGGNINTTFQFKNLWSIRGNISREGSSVDDTALRGGEALHTPGNWNYNFNLNSNLTKKISFNAGFWDNIIDLNTGRNYGIWAGLTLRPGNILSVSINSNYNYYNTELQYINTDTDIITDENRYIFGTIEQNTLTFTGRVDLNLTPDFTIQFYCSPFVSAGDYGDYKMITNPSATNYSDRFMLYSQNQLNLTNWTIDENLDGVSDYNINNANYNFREYNSNLVLRWEYIPGSVVFLVWSQSRSSFTDVGEFDYINDMDKLFSNHSNDVFLIKLQHRFRAENWFN